MTEQGDKRSREIIAYCHARIRADYPRFITDDVPVRLEHMIVDLVRNAPEFDTGDENDTFIRDCAIFTAILGAREPEPSELCSHDGIIAAEIFNVGFIAGLYADSTDGSPPDDYNSLHKNSE